MGLTKQNRNTGLFFGFFLLAGAANFFSRSGIPSLDGLLAFVNYLFYIGLLLFWIEAVRVRLLPSAAKTGIMSAAFLMLTYMLLRIVNLPRRKSRASLRRKATQDALRYRNANLLFLIE